MAVGDEVIAPVHRDNAADGLATLFDVEVVPQCRVDQNLPASEPTVARRGLAFRLPEAVGDSDAGQDIEDQHASPGLHEKPGRDEVAQLGVDELAHPNAGTDHQLPFFGRSGGLSPRELCQETQSQKTEEHLNSGSLRPPCHGLRIAEIVSVRITLTWYNQRMTKSSQKLQPPPSDLDALKTAMATGSQPRFLFFWGHTAKAGRLGNECFSQWYPHEFEIDGQRYPTAEHYMMAEKARLFGDSEHLEEILVATSPGAAKALGRKVRGFDQARWGEARSEIVVRGNLAKFGQNEALRAHLLKTGDQILVEAAPRDRIWGIGLGAKNPRAENPHEWRGLNLLGFALMQVRATLAAL